MARRTKTIDLPGSRGALARAGAEAAAMGTVAGGMVMGGLYPTIVSAAESDREAADRQHGAAREEDVSSANATAPQADAAQHMAYVAAQHDAQAAAHPTVATAPTEQAALDPAQAPGLHQPMAVDLPAPAAEAFSTPVVGGAGAAVEGGGAVPAPAVLAQPLPAVAAGGGDDWLTASQQAITEAVPSVVETLSQMVATGTLGSAIGSVVDGALSPLIGNGTAGAAGPLDGLSESIDATVDAALSTAMGALDGVTGTVDGLLGAVADIPASLLGGSDDGPGLLGIPSALLGGEEDGGLGELPVIESVAPIAFDAGETVFAALDHLPLNLGFLGQSYTEGTDAHEGGLGSLTHGLL